MKDFIKSMIQKIISNEQSPKDQVIEEKRQPGHPVEFHGWIAGDKEDEGLLCDLGVRGKMIWVLRDNSGFSLPNFHPHIAARRKKGVFTYCTITLDLLDILLKEYPAFSPRTFTGVREDGEQTLDQPLWYWQPINERAE